ncbi:MAG: trypsin-like peptidase domain-containing protein [Patescibacteria group bacterium]
MTNSHEDQIIEAIRAAMPSVASIMVGKDYETILKKEPSQLLVPLNEEYGAILPEDELPHTKGGKVRIGGGTGFIVDPSGLILTNKHVVHDPDAEYLVSIMSEEAIPARVLARDPLNDVAILKVDRADVPALHLGDSDAVTLGQTVITVGTALGEFQNTVSSGIISGLSRFITAMTDLEGNSERLHDLIQTDAAINPGNSGGPMINLRGEVVGINTAVVFGAQNIGFAIPVNRAKRDLAELRAYGRIRRPFLGVRYALITPRLQKRMRLPVERGALVFRDGIPGSGAIIPDSPAAKAGIREGDIILSLNETAIDEKTGIEDILEKVELGKTMPARILRSGIEQSMEIQAEERKEKY